MRRTISGMIGAGSLAHNRRDFIAENVDPDRVHLNICYQNENLKEVYKELFDDSVKRYNVGKRKDRQITNYYEKIRQGKQEKLFHEVIFQIGNREDMAVGTTEGDLAVKVLDEYVKNFQQRNPTLHVFNCYLHQDEATPHLHIDFVPYVTGWKGKGMDTRVSLKQALKSLGFQGGNKHDTELNQWINHEKELLAEIARQHGIEWEQKGTHEEHLDVYNFKKKERKKEVQALEQEKEYLTAENEGLTAQIAEARADIQLLKDDKEQAVKDKEEAEKRAEKAEKDLHSLEERRERLQPVMDNVSKEIKEYTNNGIPLIIQELINNLILKVLEKRNRSDSSRNVQYMQLLFLKYKDGAPMLTIGGILVDDELKDRIINSNILQKLIYCSRDNECFNIEVPKLTYKEIQLVLREIPITDKEYEENKERFHGIGLDEIRKFEKIYRYYPYYTEGCLNT